MAHETILAVDIGGTKMACAVVRSDTGEVLAADRCRTEGDDAESLFATLCELIDGVRRSAPGSTSIGVGCGGPMSAHGELVSPLNIGQWRDFALRARLAQRYSSPVFVDNDAKALALGEGWLGAAMGQRDYLAMVVSTGVGGGIVLDGRLLDGAGSNAGHIGHVIVDPLGAPCACGARGCLEAEASGTAIARATGLPAAQASTAVRRRTGRLVGRAVASVCNLLDLRLAVVAGSVALGFGDVFFDAAQAELDRCCRIAHARGAKIVPTGCGPYGPLLGAAAVARRSR